MHILAAGAEVFEGVADFLNPGPERRAQAARPQQNAVDARVDPGLANQLNVAPNRQFRITKDNLRQDLREVATWAKDQGGMRGHGRLLAHREI